jgi:hypothetical protein
MAGRWAIWIVSTRGTVMVDPKYDAAMTSHTTPAGKINIFDLGMSKYNAAQSICSTENFAYFV